MPKFSLEKVESAKLDITNKLNGLQKMMAENKPENELIDKYFEIISELSTFNTGFEYYLLNTEPLTKTQKADLLTSISNVLRAVADLANSLNVVAAVLLLPAPYPKSSRILYTSQCILKTYNSPELPNLINSYNEFKLSTEGFTDKQKMKINIKSIDWNRFLSFAIGLLAVLYTICNYEAGNINNGIAWYNYRLLLPTGLAFIIYSCFPNNKFLTFTIRGAVNATGIVAIIIFFYLINPGDVPSFP